MVHQLMYHAYSELQPRYQARPASFTTRPPGQANDRYSRMAKSKKPAKPAAKKPAPSFMPKPKSTKKDGLGSYRQ